MAHWSHVFISVSFSITWFKCGVCSNSLLFDFLKWPCLRSWTYISLSRLFLGVLDDFRTLATTNKIPMVLVVEGSQDLSTAGSHRSASVTLFNHLPAAIF